MLSVAGALGTIRRRYNRFARRFANVCYGMVSGGMGALLFAVTIDRIGIDLPAAVPIGGLVVAILGGVLALFGTAAIVWTQGGRPSLPVDHELRRSDAQGFVASGSKAMVCCGGVTLEFDGLTEGDAERLRQTYDLQTHVFETGPPARAKTWWKTHIAFGALVAGILSARGMTIDHLMPLAVYTSMFLASTCALVLPRGGNVSIGIDGVRFGGDFVPYADLQQLTWSKGRLGLVRRDGSQITGTLKLDAHLAKALDEHVQKRIDAEPSDGESYERQTDEGFAAWIKRVRGRFDATSFREAPGSVDAARTLLCDAKVPFRVRVAVAVALSPVDAEFVEETVKGLAHPNGEALQEALALEPNAQDKELEKLVS